MNKTLRLLIGSLLCFCVLASTLSPAFASEPESSDTPADLTITSVEDFLLFAENCRLDSYSQGLTVSLEADLDLRGTAFFAIPMFSGTFAGNGHTISGLQLADAGSVQGLFRYLTESAEIRDLTVEGEIHPSGSRSDVGGIAGSNAGKILNCHFSGQVSGSSNVGGIAGINTVSGVIENCRMTGAVYGSHFVGGIAGDSRGVVRSCTNTAAVNTTPQQNSVELSDITLDTLTNSESASTVTDIGGITGTCSGVIRSCKNEGNVGYQQMGYNIGGISGSLTGFIYACENHGNISGRKEVGGIVGQMEPVTSVQFTTDTLNILREQLSKVSALSDQVVANAQTGSSDLGDQIGALGKEAGNAMDSLGQLTGAVETPDINLPTLPDYSKLEVPGLEDILPDRDDLPSLEDIPTPDETLADIKDSVTAAQNSLNSSINKINTTVDNIRDAQDGLSGGLSGMGGALDGLGSSTQNMTNSLGKDLDALTAQLDVINATLNNADAYLGGSFSDVSDQDTDRDTSSKVESCANYGAVLADLNAGGIAGAMSFENDLDPDDTLQISGNTSLRFSGELRTVISNCENSAPITAKKQQAGGIVGHQFLGLVKNALNTGRLNASDADYVGGIAGQSMGAIRNSHAKCEVAGNTYVGGIAGSGAVVTDCRSMVILQDTVENTGAILGAVEDARSSENDPLQGNYYLRVGKEHGAVDGINYAGCAESMEMDAFLALDQLPDAFQSVTLTLSADGEILQTYTVAPGTPLSSADIPAPPVKDGYLAYWDGLDAISTGYIYFDRTLYAVYTTPDGTIQSTETREDGRPILLLQGTFTPDAVITLSEAEDGPTPMSRQTLVEAWSFTLPEGESVTGGRYLPPEDYTPETLQVFVRNSEGEWRKADCREDASYIAFSLEADDNQFAVIHSEPVPWLWIGTILGGIVLVVLLVIWLIHRRNRGKKAAAVFGEAALIADEKSIPESAGIC